MKKKVLIRILLLILAVAAVMVVLPRADRSTYSYEEGQPWRYALLTAPFDIPVYLDSTTFQHQTDSVNKSFSPYITHQRMSESQITATLMDKGISALKAGTLARLMTHVYNEGVMPDALKKRVSGTPSRTVRSITEADENMANSIDASGMLSVSEACKWVVENYDPQMSSLIGLESADVDALQQAMIPNITLDSVNDAKYLALELQSISAGQGKIRQGQRIVDRGEIITPQIYRNLQTWEQMLSQSAESDSDQDLIRTLGSLLYVMVVYSMLYLYLAFFRPKIYADLRYLTFIISLVTIFTVLAAIMFESFTVGIYLTPFATVPVMILIFIDARTAFFSLLCTLLLCALIATYQYQFLVSEIVTGFMALISLSQLSRRSQLLRTSVVIFLSYAVMGVILLVISGGNVTDMDWRMLIAYGVNAVLFSLTYVLIVLIEKVFGFTSMVTLVELSDINHPLLRRLAEEAPGTFQHSMQVSTLAADAAHSIGANTALVRTGALYHDIGKMTSPIFFTENQHGVNPHDGLDPQTSARKIISHVTEGVNIAEKAKLPRLITDFIRQHHGRGMARYFYTTAQNESADGQVDPAPFTYPGPDPQSKEAAILMMADAVEAASRSLKEYTPQSISNLVDSIIDSQMKEGRFKDSPISFADIEKAKETFKQRLSTIYHTRVAYPQAKRPK